MYEDSFSMQKISGIFPGRKARFKVKTPQRYPAHSEIARLEILLGLTRLEFGNSSYTKLNSKCFGFCEL